MGIQETAPDTYGLPEYKISEMRIEIDGHDLRMVFGAKRFGQVQWFYTAVIEPERLMRLCREAAALAEQVLNQSMVVDGTSH